MSLEGTRTVHISQKSLLQMMEQVVEEKLHQLKFASHNEDVLDLKYGEFVANSDKPDDPLIPVTFKYRRKEAKKNGSEG